MFLKSFLFVSMFIGFCNGNVTIINKTGKPFHIKGDSMFTNTLNISLKIGGGTTVLGINDKKITVNKSTVSRWSVGFSERPAHEPNPQKSHCSFFYRKHEIYRKSSGGLEKTKYLEFGKTYELTIKKGPELSEAPACSLDNSIYIFTES